ncbi:MAG: hypothetical protein HKN09_05375, partial [Saprospiraceae bacterium]|nr:hypothetical protein [Saprospiraceae bacterium]
MMLQSTTHIVLYWSARITGSVILGFLLFMLFGHLFSEGQDGFKFDNYFEIALFICFPILTLLGLLIAYKKPLAGGIICLLSMIAFFSLQGGDVTANIYLLSP